MSGMARKRPKLDEEEDEAADGVGGGGHHGTVPDEIWLRILGTLNQTEKIQMSKTSRRFNRLCKDSSLWRTVRLDFASVKNSSSGLSTFLSQLAAVERIVVTNETYESYSEKALMSILLKTKDTLKHLVISPEVVLKNESVVSLGVLENLESLDLSGDNVTSTGLAALGKLRQLRQLRLCCLEKVNPKELAAFFSAGSGQLELLDVSDSRKGVTNGPVVALAKHSPLLKHLVLDECDSITDTALKALSEHCPLLEHLSVEGCYLLNDASIGRLARTCRNLRFLSLGLCGSAVKDTGIRALADNCPHLEHLNLFGATFVTEKGLQYLLSHCPSLRYLQIQGILGISAHFLQQTKTNYPHVEVDYFQKQHARRNRGRTSD